MNQADFENLLRRLLDGDSKDASDLEAAFAEDEARLADYLDQVELDALLRWELGEEELDLGTVAEEEMESGDAKVVAGLSDWWALANSPWAKAAAVVLLLGAGFLLGQGRPAGPQAMQTVPAPVAVLIDSEDCEWGAGPGVAHGFGDSFGAGETLQIESGIARLALWSKAGVAIMGPAEIELVSSEEVLVHYGSVSAFAPDEAIGFKLTTPDVEIVDLGTRFAASVTPDGTTDVHVFEGEISVQSRSTKETEELITTGQARRYAAGGSRSEIAIAPEQFVEPPELEQLLAIGSPDKAISGQRASRDMPDVPGVIAAQWFSGAAGELESRFGGAGFAEESWWASPSFTRLIPKVQSHSGGASAGGYLLVRGRDKAEPFVANRLRRKMDQVMPETFYFALMASYHGLDEDDFFSLWVDTNGREGASHADVPTLGIREGQYFARVDVEHDAVAGQPVDGQPFVIAGRYIWNLETMRAEAALWVNPTSVDAEPDAECLGPVMKEAPGDFRFLGLRIGKYTEVSDRLLIRGLAVGDSLESVVSAVQPQPSNP